MNLYFTRRNFLSTGAGALVTARALRSQSAAVPVAGVPIKTYEPRSTVSLIHGMSRRKNVYDAMLAIDEQILPKLKTKKRVVIKPNNVMATNQLACTHADAIRGVLDYLAPRFKGPITIAESASGDTWTGYRNFNYPDLVKEYASRQVELVDLNQDGKFVNQAILDQDAHIVPVRLAARLLDNEAFVIGLAMLKSHNYVIATLGVKNMVLGAPLHSTMTAADRFNHKSAYHAGYHMMHYNMVLTAQTLLPNFGVSVIDGYEGMEGNGPTAGTPVDSRVAIASTDFIAADRVGIDCMGVDPQVMGYLRYCDQVGLGNYNPAKIDIRGSAIATVRKEYRLNSDVERQLTWKDPLDVEDGSWIGPRGRRNDYPARKK
jgi:uncharacterized protein (DUF362 family)